MSTDTIRIGIVGAGANTRLRHVPGFRAIEGVELVGVVNRSPESSARAAEEFGIPRVYENWQELVADDGLDAVMIGTWPNVHCEITCAALEAGKHVMVEARMARTAAEAQQMLAASRARPDLVTQIVPSPFAFFCLDHVRGLVDDGFLGEFRELVVIGANDQFHDVTTPLHWRQDREISGLNVLAMGILHEAALRWAPEPRRVFAQVATFGPERPDGPATIPDSVQVVTELEGGGRGLYHLSGIALHGPGFHLHLYGSDGTIRVDLGAEQLMIGRSGDQSLHEPEIPQEQRGGWRVEEEFIGAIRGEESIRLTDFETGVKYMEFTEAVARSAETGQPVDLPLDG
ncbi:MAG: Gfo/Idh/MocA family oxidoreductase [Planctomycetaceae bacterium]|jgi:predicted dehydrogenase|nr:Gfo/Idh/MocA family oxidoreductase [Planctomycetaceae bacterium]